MLRLSRAANAAIAEVPGVGTIGNTSVADPDAAPPVLSIDSPSVQEGDPGAGLALGFTVTLSAASARPVTVR